MVLILSCCRSMSTMEHLKTSMFIMTISSSAQPILVLVRLAVVTEHVMLVRQMPIALLIVQLHQSVEMERVMLMRIVLVVKQIVVPVDLNAGMGHVMLMRIALRVRLIADNAVFR